VSYTDPIVATVAAMVTLVPISADRTGEEDCTGGDGRLHLALCFFAAICRSCLVRSFEGAW
jgi:hypothetical protein